MAKKRAQVDAILTATAASDIFTQDLEDIVANQKAYDAEVTATPVASAMIRSCVASARASAATRCGSSMAAMRITAGWTSNKCIRRATTRSLTIPTMFAGRRRPCSSKPCRIRG